MKNNIFTKFKNTRTLLSFFCFFLFSLSLSFANTNCDNLTYGGEIASDQTICNPGDVPEKFINVTLPSGGSGDVEYIWIYTTDNPNDRVANWSPIPGSINEYYQAGPVFENTYFRRCARNSGCTEYIVESNWVYICVDKEAPHFTFVPSHFETDCNDFIGFSDPSFEDDCDKDITLTYEDVIADEGCLVNYIRTWTITDDCGNQAFANQVITTSDNESPTISLESPYEHIQDGDVLNFPCDDILFFDETSVNIYDNCDDDVEVSFVDNFYMSGNCIEDGYLSVYECIWTATDDCGNTTSFTVYLNIVDDVDPHFTFVPEDGLVNCNEDPVFGEPTFEDNCDNDLELTSESTVSSVGCTMYYTTTWTITDDCGNHATASQTINTTDDQAPVIYLNAPYDAYMDGDVIKVPCDDVPFLDETSVNVSDNCSDNIAVTFVDVFSDSGNCEVDGYLAVYECIWTATDACGNISTFTIYINVVDEEDPFFTFIPEDGEVDCNEIPMFGTPTFADNCDNDLYLETELTSESDGCKKYYTTTWTVTDDCGNEASASQTISAVDNQAPIISLNAPLEGVMNGDTLYYECTVDFFLDETSVTITDNCDQDPNFSFQDDFYSSDDCKEDGYLEKMKCYWIATDNCGNLSTFVIYIFVTDETAPIFTSIPEDILGECGDELDFGDPTFKDNCDSDVTLTEGVTSTGNSCEYVMTKNWTITDDCGNSSVASQTITLVDTQAPIINLGGDFEHVMDGDTLIFNCKDAVYFQENSAVAYDNCSDSTIITFADEFYQSDDCAADGYLEKAYCIWTATDECGNSSTFTIYVYVLDNEDPVFTYVPEDVTLDCLADPEETGVPIYMDDCDDDLEVEYEIKAIGDECYLKYIRVWIVTDDCGNSARAAQVVHTTDETAPVILNLNPVTGTDCTDFVINEPDVSDDCDADPNILVRVDTIYNDGFIDLKINWTIVDYCGNETTAYQPVTVPCSEGFIFTNIQASRIGDETVRVEWGVENDLLGANYVIETSANGSDFATVNAIIPAFGAAYIGDNNYAFEIVNNYGGRSFYRVRYIDAEGLATLSDKDMLENFNVNTHALIYPNPALANATIEFANPVDESSTIKIYNLQGMLLNELISKDLQTNVNLSTFEAGTYFIHYRMNGKDYTQRFIKVDE